MLALTYKDYTGEVDFDLDLLCWIGQVVHASNMIGFCGGTLDEAEQDLRAAVDAYLTYCEQLGQPPQPAEAA